MITPDDLRMLDEWRHDRISETDFATLHARLEESSELRAELRALATIETGLTALAEPGFPLAFDDSATSKKPLREQLWLPWTTAGLAAALALFFGIKSISPDSTVTNPVASPSYTALLVDEAGAVFARHRDPGEVGFSTGDYELKDGTAHLRYTNGADLVIQGPAKFRIENEKHTLLETGRVRAIVPPPARGFTIETPQLNFEDVGTEFALSVDSSTGESGMQVLDGQVNLRRKGDSSLLHEVFGGEWIRYRDGAGMIKNATALDLSLFPSPGNIGYLRWRQERERILADPNVIAWFPFVRESNQSVLTNAQRRNGIPDGRIAGARWVSGRWPGKESLLFDRETDYAQIEIPGKYSELTVAAWLKVDRYDQEMHAILNSNGSEPGDMHLQLTRHGLPRGGIIGVERPIYEWVGNPVPIAKWTHLVQVISMPERIHHIYVNGDLVTKTALEQQDSVTISPGYCRLGNWLKSADYLHQSNRNFKGRIDELTIWNRALSLSEINDLMERGRPSLLWNRENPPMGGPLPKP